jgi:hypothetical protein
VAEELGLDLSASSMVSIDRRRLNLVANHLQRAKDLAAISPHAWDNPLFWNVDGTPEERSQFFAIGSAINFRFWELDGDRLTPAKGIIEGQEFRGSMYMWRSLRRAQGRLPILEAEFLASLQDWQFDAIFTDDRGVNPLSVARLDRMMNLRELGQSLRRDWHGSFYELARATDESVVEFARLLARIRPFDDPLYKLTMVNAILHSGSGVYRFHDDPLPGIDYQLLKQLLRQGVLAPSGHIVHKLTQGQLLAADEAYELRRVALVAFVELCRMTGLSGAILDNKYWWNRLNCRDVAPVCINPETASRCPFLDVCSQSIQFGLPLEITRYY